MKHKLLLLFIFVLLISGCDDIYCSGECYKCKNLCFQDICSPDDVDDWKGCWNYPNSQDYCQEECKDICDIKCNYGK